MTALQIPTTPPLSGGTLVADVNTALGALANFLASPTAPTTGSTGLTSTSGVVWHDTTANLLKIRDQADGAWITLGTFDETNKLFSSSLKTDSSLRQIAASSAWSVNEAITSVSTAQTINATTHNSNFVATGACAFNLALTTGLTNGGCAFAVLAQGGAVTLTPNVADAIVVGSTVQATGATYVVAAGSSAFIITDGAGKWYVYFMGSASSSLAIPVRQCVLSASGDNNIGTPWLTAGSGLAVNLSATSVPVRLAFAAGFGPSGAVDYVGSLTADVVGAWSGLSANATNYLFVQRNTSTGAVTCGFTINAPTSQQGGTTSVVNGQFTYRADQGVMWLGNGAAANPLQVLFVGEAVTGASSVTSVVNYALLGRYVGGWTNTLPSASTVVTAADNLGTTFKNTRLEISCLTADSGFLVGDVTEAFMTNPVAGTTLPLSGTRRRNATIFTTAATPFWITNAATGVGVAPTAVNWAYRIRADRGF